MRTSIIVLALAAAVPARAGEPGPNVEPPLTLGVTRPIGQDEASFAASAIKDTLAHALSRGVEPRVYDSYDALADALAEKRIDLAWITPLAYARASQKAKVAPIRKCVRGGKTIYRSAIFVGEESALKELKDLKGKKVAFVRPGSASGYAFPRELLRKAKLDPDKDITPLSFDDHRAVCLAVMEGKVDAGATLSDERPAGEAPQVDGCREALQDINRPLRILAVSDPIPNDVVAARPDLAPDLVKQVGAWLDKLPDSKEGQRLLYDAFKAEKFTAVKDEEFAAARALLGK
jgi:phosphonate transport system substrate-binding protein